LAVFCISYAWADETLPDTPQVEQDVSQITAKVSVPPEFDTSGDKTKPLFVEFAASTKLTDELRTALAAEGYQLVGSRDAAVVIYELDGAFQALRPATKRTAEIRAGDFAEKPDSLTTKTGRGRSVMFSLNPIAMIVGTIASNVGDATGARDAVNGATVGDPDGKCLAKCDKWEYRQRAVINLTRIEAGASTKVISVSSINAIALEPGTLFARSAKEIAAVLRVPIQFDFKD